VAGTVAVVADDLIWATRLVEANVKVKEY